MGTDSPYYGRIGYPALDRPDLSLNYKLMVGTGGTEWRMGMTEDLAPIGAVFQFSINWNTGNRGEESYPKH